MPANAPGELRLVLSNGGGGALLALPGGPLALLLPSSSPRLASLFLALRLSALLAASVALAAGLGAWLRPSLTTVLVLALALAGASPDLGLALPAAAGSGEALRGLAEGTAPGPVAATALVEAGASVLLGAALLTLSLRRGRALR